MAPTTSLRESNKEETMQGAQFPQADATQAHVDHHPLEQDGSIQPVDANPTPMADLLAKVPNLALLAAGFFAASPFLSPTVMGGKH
jgi:hypothetical protein